MIQCDVYTSTYAGSRRCVLEKGHTGRHTKIKRKAVTMIPDTENIHVLREKLRRLEMDVSQLRYALSRTLDLRDSARAQAESFLQRALKAEAEVERLLHQNLSTYHDD